VDPDLRRGDVEVVAIGPYQNDVMPAKAGTHASLSESDERRGQISLSEKQHARKKRAAEGAAALSCKAVE
jgi:hypothetical protein